MEHGACRAHGGWNVSSIIDAIKAANADHRPLRIVGAGTWLNAGRPTHASQTLSLREHSGLVEYVPGDLTLTARAGTTLAEIESATEPHGQWLPIDPWGSNAGTLGATVSTATAGPQAFAAGLPRDVVLGMEFVTGAGEVVRSGGRVVKNVAGFDLTRLLVGSWGTLGVISELTVRLRARPDQTRSFGIAVPMDRSMLNELATKLRALPFTPMASELVNSSLAESIGLGPKPLLLCRIGGNARSVAAQRDLLTPLGSVTELSEGIWTKLRAVDVASNTGGVWRWSQLPTLFGETWTAAERGTAQGDMDSAMLHGNPARGVVRVLTNGEPPRLARTASAFAGTVAIETLPTLAWSLVPDRVAGDPISRGIRAKFDPNGVLNSGILGEMA